MNILEVINSRRQIVGPYWPTVFSTSSLLSRCVSGELCLQMCAVYAPPL
jgi:hypothetical protein